MEHLKTKVSELEIEKVSTQKSLDNNKKQLKENQNYLNLKIEENNELNKQVKEFLKLSSSVKEIIDGNLKCLIDNVLQALKEQNDQYRFYHITKNVQQLQSSLKMIGIMIGKNITDQNEDSKNRNKFLISQFENEPENR